MSANHPLTSTVLLVGMTAGVFAAFGPALFMVDRKVHDIGRVRWAEMAGATVTVAMGWALAHDERSTKPLIASVLVALGFVTAYEFMLRSPADRTAI